MTRVFYNIGLFESKPTVTSVVDYERNFVSKNFFVTVITFIITIVTVLSIPKPNLQNQKLYQPLLELFLKLAKTYPTSYKIIYLLFAYFYFIININQIFYQVNNILHKLRSFFKAFFPLALQ